jgi:hypothetical protein
MGGLYQSMWRPNSSISPILIISAVLAAYFFFCTVESFLDPLYLFLVAGKGVFSWSPSHIHVCLIHILSIKCYLSYQKKKKSLLFLH